MMNIRQRHIQPEDKEDTTTFDVGSLVKKVKNFDIYAKAEDDHTIRTTTGGLTSIISLAFMLLLFLSELISYLTIHTSHSILVDTRTAQKLKINFNITLHSLPCSSSAIDVMDVSGEQQLDADTNIQRYRLNSEGKIIGPATLGSHNNNNNNINDAAYLAGIANILGVAPDSLPSNNNNPHNNNNPEKEGCNIAGSLLVNKVAGNVHIALGSSQARHVKHVHQFVLNEMLAFNASHTIHQLSFGDSFPGQFDPLNGVSNIIQSGTAHFQYFIKVVPTIYVDESGYMPAGLSSSTNQQLAGPAFLLNNNNNNKNTNNNDHIIDTNQYSVTEQTHSITASDAFKPDGRKIPGLFFVYDLSPFMVRVKKTRRRFSSFATSCAAIIGGVLTVMGIIDSLVYYLSKTFQKLQNDNGAIKSGTSITKVKK